jgi:mannose-6-phosphate isomerase-like protein (cupin superfamily)
MTTMKKVGGIMLAPGEGERIVGGGVNATVKVTTSQSAFASTFEVLVPPGYDVGAHLHSAGEEIFYVVRGQLDVLAFEPLDRSVPNWREWVSEDGRRYLRGGPGSFLYVPAGVPHAFGNPTGTETLMFFQSSIGGGHENYFRELAELLGSSGGRPPPSEVLRLRRKYDIEQLTGLFAGH